MANILPSALNESTTVSVTDILVVQNPNETEVKKITKGNLLSDYYNKTEVEALDFRDTSFLDLPDVVGRDSGETFIRTPDMSLSLNFNIKYDSSFTLENIINPIEGETGYIVFQTSGYGSPASTLTLGDEYITEGGLTSIILTVTPTANDVIYDILRYTVMNSTTVFLEVLLNVKPAP